MEQEQLDSLYDHHEYTSIHVAILFADLENSVMISSALSGPEYDKLINSYQATMIELVQALQHEGMRIGEYNVAGDQLAIFFYDEHEVERNYALDGPEPLAGPERQDLIRLSAKLNEETAYSALKAAIQLKNRWLVQSANLERVLHHREPLGLAIGLHYGRAYLTNRPDGQRRIEGFTINLAKRIEGFARQGQFSRIMISQKMRDLIRTSVVKHTQLRQRVFFHRHDVAMELLKGVSRAQAVYELKFYHLIGVHVPPEAIQLYESIFAVDHTNSWAYNQLVDYYAYHERDWARVMQLAKIAVVVHPEDEKVYYDLSKCYYQLGNFAMSKHYAEDALRINSGFDLAHEQLALIASQLEDIDAQVRHWRDAVALSPSSAVNHFNLGLALSEAGGVEMAEYHIREAVRLFPQYVTWPAFISSVHSLLERGKLPEDLAELLPAAEASASSG